MFTCPGHLCAVCADVELVMMLGLLPMASGSRKSIVIRLEARLQPSTKDSLSSALRMHDFTDFRRPDFTKFKHKTSIGVAMNTFGTEFLKFSRKESFFQKTQKIHSFQRLATSDRHNSAVITDRWNFATK